MKRLTALFMALCLLMTVTPMAVFAETETVISADGYADGGQGNGFFDSSQGEEIEVTEIEGKTAVILREKEWVKYDISSLASGTYSVSINVGSTANGVASVSVDDIKMIGYCEFLASGSIDVLNEAELGKIYISEGATDLKLINDKVMINTANASFVYDSIKLTYIDDAPEFSLSATSVIPGGEGIGSHSERYVGGLSSTSPELGADCNSYSSICLRHTGKKDWVKYDVSYLPEGTYALSVCNAGVKDVNARITLENENGREYTTNFTIPKSNSKNYTTFAQTDDLCQFFVREGSLTLKLDSQDSTYNLKNITLKYLSDENLTLKTKMEINPANIYSNVEGVGFYDNANAGKWEVGTLGGRTEKFIIFRSGEWGKYDISSMKPGTYCLISNASNTSASSFVVTLDDEKQGVTIELPSTGSFGNLVDNYSPLFEIEDGDLHLKITSGSQPIYSYMFTLVQVSALEVLSVKGDIGEDNNTIGRGSGLIKLELSSQISEGTETITLKDSNENAVSFYHKIDGNNINIFLNEPLKALENYSVTINNLYDIYGQALNETISFSTTDKGDNSGGGSFEVNQWIYEDNTFEIVGKVYSTQKEILKNKEVYIDVVNPEGMRETMSETLSDENGIFNLSYTFPKDTKSGAYRVVICGDAMGGVSEEYIVNFFDKEGEEEFVSSFKNKTAEEIASAIDSYSEILNLDTERITEKISDINSVYSKLAGKEFESSKEIIALLNSAIYTEYVNSAEDDNELKFIYDEFLFRKYLDLDSKYLDLLSEEETNKLISDIKANKPYNESNDISERINAKVNDLLIERYDVAIQIDVTSSVSVTEGQIGSLDISFDEDETNISTIELEIEMVDTSFFDSENVTVKPNKYMEILSQSIENKKLNLKLKADSERETGAICTINITAPFASKGNYEVKVSGNVTLSYEELGKYEIQSPEFEEKVSAFEVKEKSSGGGSYEGSNSSMPNYPSKPVDHVTSEDGAKKPMFRDLNGYNWAEEAICALAEKGIIEGRGDAIFAPGDYITRSEFCKMLILSFGISTDDAQCDFEDVPKDSWSYKYVAAAYKNGIVNGVSQTIFNGNANLSREDMAVIIYRIVAVGKTASTNSSFADGNQISGYAKTAVDVLCEMGIVNGMGDNTFSPKTNVTRAQAAQIIYRVLNMEV